MELGNYNFVLGNSGCGKTTLVKTIVEEYKKEQKVKVVVCDPNRSWSDLQDIELSPSDFLDAINKVGRPLIYKGEKAILILEDIGLLLHNVSMATGKPLYEVKNAFKLILENARKYGIRVIAIGHRLQSDEIDETLFQQFDTITAFKFPLTTHAKKLLKMRDITPEMIEQLPKFEYWHVNGSAPEHGQVQPLASHIKIEGDRLFQTRMILKKCKSNPERVALLRGHLGFNNAEIAKVLKMNEKEVSVYLARVRKRFRRDLGLVSRQEVKWLPDLRRVHASHYQSLLF